MGSSRSMRCIRVGSRSDFIFISRGFSSCARGKWLCSAANATGGRLDGHAARQNGTLFSWSVLESARVASAIEPHQLTKFPSSKRLMSSVIHVEPVGGHWRSAREGLIYWLFISAVISGDLVDDCRKKNKSEKWTNPVGQLCPGKWAAKLCDFPYQCWFKWFKTFNVTNCLHQVYDLPQSRETTRWLFGLLFFVFWVFSSALCHNFIRIQISILG